MVVRGALPQAGLGGGEEVEGAGGCGGPCRDLGGSLFGLVGDVLGEDESDDPARRIDPGGAAGGPGPVDKARDVRAGNEHVGVVPVGVEQRGAGERSGVGRVVEVAPHRCPASFSSTSGQATRPSAVMASTMRGMSADAGLKSAPRLVRCSKQPGSKVNRTHVRAERRTVLNLLSPVLALCAASKPRYHTPEVRALLRTGCGRHSDDLSCARRSVSLVVIGFTVM